MLGILHNPFCVMSSRGLTAGSRAYPTFLDSVVKPRNDGVN